MIQEIKLKNVSYSQLRKGEWLTDFDKYGFVGFVNKKV